MRAIFRAELKIVRQAVALVCAEMDLFEGMPSEKHYPAIGIFGQDGCVTVDYPEAEPIMRVIGFLAHTGSLEYVK